jgi:uncharacterized protein YbjT (DUF2867 family)
MATTEAQKSAILLGASGLVGGFCLQVLLKDPRYARITALNRRPLPPTAHSKLTQQIVDFAAFAPADFRGADDIFCALGSTIRKAGSREAYRRVDLEYPLAAANAAKQAGAQQFILVSSVGADPASKSFYLRTKGELEQELAKAGFRALHIFRPSLLLGKREEFRLGERVMIALAPAFNVAMIGRLRRYRAISAADVGRAMVVAAGLEKSGTFVYEHDEIVELLGGAC